MNKYIPQSVLIQFRSVRPKTWSQSVKVVFT